MCGSRKFEKDGIEYWCGKPWFGLWGINETDVRFDPYPKREREIEMTDEPFARLCVRDLGGAESSLYDKAIISPEGEEAAKGEELALEQPDWVEGGGLREDMVEA